MIVTTTYERRTFRVQAIQVTDENKAEIAEWCSGDVKVYHPEDHMKSGDYRDGQECVEVVISRVMGQVTKARAYTGDWVTRLGDIHNYRVYRGKSFLQAFQQIASDEQKYAEVHQIIVNAMRQQDAATYNGESSRGMDLVADKATRAVLGLF